MNKKNIYHKNHLYPSKSKRRSFWTPQTLISYHSLDRFREDRIHHDCILIAKEKCIYWYFSNVSRNWIHKPLTRCHVSKIWASCCFSVAVWLCAIKSSLYSKCWLIHWSEPGHIRSVVALRKRCHPQGGISPWRRWLSADNDSLEFSPPAVSLHPSEVQTRGVYSKHDQ